ncbi:MAG: hypothetical protein UH241_08010 [Acutalibacteraceae bacterium]|nr:hypothetical protein [Acutalibacteraceae bacterium]
MNNNQNNGGYPYNYNFSDSTPTPTPPVEHKENVFLGIIGAFLFSLVGGILWYVLYQIGIIAAISGFVGTMAAVYGYFIFSKGESLVGVIISVVISLLVLVGAWYVCLATEVYNLSQELYNTQYIDYQVTFVESFGLVPELLAAPKIGFECWKDLIFGLIFALAGSVKHLASLRR